MVNVSPGYPFGSDSILQSTKCGSHVRRQVYKTTNIDVDLFFFSFRCSYPRGFRPISESKGLLGNSSQLPEHPDYVYSPVHSNYKAVATDSEDGTSSSGNRHDRLNAAESEYSTTHNMLHNLGSKR